MVEIIGDSVIVFGVFWSGKGGLKVFSVITMLPNYQVMSCVGTCVVGIRANWCKQVFKKVSETHLSLKQYQRR